jgi:hypothetical protein
MNDLVTGRNLQQGKGMTSVTTVFSGDQASLQVGIVSQISDRTLTQTYLTCINDNEYSTDGKSLLLPLSRTKALDDITLSESTRFVEATDGTRRISG